MKKNYERPSVEVVEFRYSDQVVAHSGCKAEWIYNQLSQTTCKGIPVEWFN